MKIRVIGGGLAGPEAALTIARFGLEVDLYEMRPVRTTPAHQTADFGELVCSNSLKSESENTAPWLLKQEMRRAGSPLLACADRSAVPAGHALAVDRVEFSRLIQAAIENEPLVRVLREEVTHLDPDDGITIEQLREEFQAALDKETAKKARSDDESARVDEIKEAAKTTGEKQLIRKYSEECNDRNEQCNMDIVHVWAMPDGTIQTTRTHTW